MSRLHLPRHSATHKFAYVWDIDPAWRHDRITSEVEEAAAARDRALEERGREADLSDLDDPNRHPVYVYLSGETRYDLGAPIPWGGREVSAKEYLADGYVAWHIGRLRSEQKMRIADMFAHYSRKSSGGELQPTDTGYGTIMRHCCVYGLLGVLEGLPEFDFVRVHGRVSEQTMDQIDAIGDTQGVQMGTNLIRKLGEAVYRASTELTDAEKKP